MPRLPFAPTPGKLPVSTNRPDHIMPTDAQRIQTDPDYYEPFRIAQAYRVGDLVITSGQAALDKSGKVVGVGDFDAQADQTFANLAEVLAAGGSSLSRVVKVTIYLKDMANFPRILSLRERYFTPPYPADTIVEVASLALPELEIEIEAIALAAGDVHP
jgi:reactive intermediate/imine deaminase